LRKNRILKGFSEDPEALKSYIYMKSAIIKIKGEKKMSSESELTQKNQRKVSKGVGIHESFLLASSLL